MNNIVNIFNKMSATTMKYFIKKDNRLHEIGSVITLNNNIKVSNPSKE
jgi:hypothetical protein